MTTKQVIVIRKDLKMRRGKEIAQGAHVATMWLAQLVQQAMAGEPVQLTVAQREWLEGSFAKICVRVNSEEELLQVHMAAVAAGLASYLVADEGRTEFGGQPTITACAIGPDYADKIDSVTGNLSLY